MVDIREIDEDELDRFVAAMRAALDEADTAEGYLDWKRQARETTWLVASEGERDVGAAIGIGGWHSPGGRRARRGAAWSVPRVAMGSALRCSASSRAGRAGSAIAS